MNMATSKPTHHVAAADEGWLALRLEDPIEPSLPIIDAHHHLWDFSSPPYLGADFAADATGTHNIRASIYVECGMKFFMDGPVELQPVGETSFVVAEAEKVPSDRQVAAGIVGMADLTLGDRVDHVLDAHMDAGKGRFRGIRVRAAWDADPEASYGASGVQRGVLLRREFQDGARRLTSKNLTLDIWAFHTQLSEVSQFADACPNTTIVLDHMGGPLGVGTYQGKRQEVFDAWATGIRELARRRNIYVKLGGFGVPRLGWHFSKEALPPSSDELAALWGPYVETCLESFGPHRSMFESNFPVDKAICSMNVLLNAYKKMVAACSAAERSAVFFETAATVYRVT